SLRGWLATSFMVETSRIPLPKPLIVDALRRNRVAKLQTHGLLAQDTCVNTLDRIDLLLLGELQRNGRLTNADLAERVHLSPSACLRRVQRLERDGVIAGYRAEVDP